MTGEQREVWVVLRQDNSMPFTVCVTGVYPDEEQAANAAHEAFQYFCRVSAASASAPQFWWQKSILHEVKVLTR